MSSLIIMGAGKIGQLVYDEMIYGGESYDEVYYYDNDIKKQCTLINGVYVLSYEECIEKVKNQECEVVLATDYWKELFDFCKSLYVEDKIVGIYNRMSFWSNPYVKHVYGQDAEELYLEEKFEEECGAGYKGFYVDIGAHHPYRFSNTHWAYVKGWHGINIEPNTDAVEVFKKVRRRDININCGVGSEEKIMKYYKFDEPAFNTFDETEFCRLRMPKEVVSVPVIPLETILAQYQVNKIDFMNIDVEGLEMQVLRSNNWKKYRPAFILVEQKNISVRELVKSDMYLYLKDLGYECEWKGIRTAIYRVV